MLITANVCLIWYKIVAKMQEYILNCLRQLLLVKCSSDPYYALTAFVNSLLISLFVLIQMDFLYLDAIKAITVLLSDYNLPISRI